MKKLKNVLSAAAVLFREKVKAAKWYSRIVVTGIVGFGLYCATAMGAEFIHDTVSNHTAGALVAAILAVNVYVSYPTLKRGLTNLKSWGEKLFREPESKKNTSIETPVMAATATPAVADADAEAANFAAIAAEFATEVATVTDEELREEE